MKLDPKSTAFLSLDLQAGVLAMVPGANTALAPAAKAAEFARIGGFHLIHVGVGFSLGYPEIPETGSRFAMAREKNLFIKGSPTAEFDPSVYKSGEMIIYKHRVSAFSENELNLVLRSRKIDTLVLFGIATSGIVLSTLRQASDLDYRCFVLKDACLDRDEEVHRVLTEKVFPGQASVMTVDNFISEKR